MADKLQLAMGLDAGLDSVAVEAGKILYTTDTRKLYIDAADYEDHQAINAAHADTATLASTANTWTTGRTLTVGSTGKTVTGGGNVSWSHAEIGATVSNTWTGGTTSGPTLSTTVNGVKGTAVAIPAAAEAASGIVTTGDQTFSGTKTFKKTIVGSVSGSAATWTTPRTFSIGSAATEEGVSVNGSGNVELKLPKTITGLTSVTSTAFVGALTGNADTASKLAKAFTLNLTGSVTGTASIDGSGTVSLATTTNHTHNYAGSSSAGGAANSVKSNLTIGGKTYNGSTAVSITLSDLGLANAMHFLGTTTTAISDGSKTTSITIGSNTVTAQAGDVVLYNQQEFVFTSAGAWEELGSEGSFALKTRTITGSGALSGGGSLEENRTITHVTTGVTGRSNASQTKSITGSGASGSFTIPVIAVDTYGHVKYTADSTVTLTMPTLPTIYNLTLATSTTVASAATTSATFDPDSKAASFTVYTMKGATASAAGFGGLVPAPAAGTTYRALLANGSWGEPGIEWGSF